MPASFRAAEALERGARTSSARPIDESELRPVRLRISKPALLAELSDHYARSGFGVRRVGPDELEVTLADAPSEDQGRREVGAHLLVWEVIHPECRGEIVD